MSVRPEVDRLADMGAFPPETSRDMVLIQAYDMALKSIQAPLSDEEARRLVKVFGCDGCFGMASALMHLIETAPGWPLVDCLVDNDNEWINELRNRCIRSGRIASTTGVMPTEFGAKS